MLSAYSTQPYFYKVFLHLKSLIISKKEYRETIFQIVFNSISMQEDLYKFLPSVLVSGLQTSMLLEGSGKEFF